MTSVEELDRTLDVSEHEKELAQNALSEFKRKNYVSCLQILNKLDRSYDFKVSLNKSVVEFFKSDCKKVENFEKALTALCNQFQVRLEKLDNVDHCIIHYNHAVLLFHRQQYTAALWVMDRIYKFIEPMDDVLARQVSLLAIELQLCIKMPDKALSLINYIETHLLNPGNSSESKIKTSNKPTVTQSENKSDKEKQLISTESFIKKLQIYKIKCYLMKHLISTGSQQLENVPNDKNSYETLFLKGNVEYLKGNYDTCMKILNSIPEDSITYEGSGESSAIMISNNIGVLYHALGKPNLACHYFQKALKMDIGFQNQLKKENQEKPLYMLGGSRYHEIMYNLGIALLHAKKPAQAFDCLIISVRRYHRNARLWMRLAECCIMVHKSSNEIDFDIAKKQKDLVVDIIGQKDSRKFVMTTNLSQDKKYWYESQSYAVPVPSLEFASLCLRNAHLLLPSDTNNSPVPVFLIPGVTPPAPTPSPGPAPSSPISSEGVIILKNGILAASAYVCLCLGDYILALEHAKKLLNEPRVSEVHKFLAHLYCAEALVLLDRIPEALDHLNPENVKGISLNVPENTDKNPKEEEIKTAPKVDWFPNTLASAHATMQYNLAVAKTIRGELDQAAAILKNIWQMRNYASKVPAHIIMLVIYIELMLGHAEIARNLMKQYSFPLKIHV